MSKNRVNRNKVQKLKRSTARTFTDSKITKGSEVYFFDGDEWVAGRVTSKDRSELIVTTNTSGTFLRTQRWKLRVDQCILEDEFDDKSLEFRRRKRQIRLSPATLLT
jgi:hypothetical protein